MTARTSQQARLMVEADKDARFDWAAWNRTIDEGLAGLERLNQIEAQQAQARISMARDVRAIIEGQSE